MSVSPAQHGGDSDRELESCPEPPRSVWCGGTRFSWWEFCGETSETWEWTEGDAAVEAVAGEAETGGTIEVSSNVGENWGLD